MRTILKYWLQYFQTRRWGLQMLIRMTFSEKVFFRHLIVFCVGLILSLTILDPHISDTRAFIEFRTNILRKVNFTNFDNQKGSNKLLIPNYIHYIRLEQPEIRFFEAVCMKSAFIIQRPDKIFIHTDTPELTGKYWKQLLDIPGFRDVLVIQKVVAPSQVFGVEFYWNAHKADVLRLLILKKYGGIYLDNDIYVINNLDKYRRFEFTLGWPDGEWIGNMLLMGHKDARFITQFIDTYKNYRPDVWYYNGGEKPVREILWRYPNLVPNEKIRLGVTTNVAWFFYVNSRSWDPKIWLNEYDTLHLLIGHRKDIDPRYEEVHNFDEENIKYLNMNVPMMLRYYWFGTFATINNGTVIDMERVNRAWLDSGGIHENFNPIVY